MFSGARAGARRPGAGRLAADRVDEGSGGHARRQRRRAPPATTARSSADQKSLVRAGLREGRFRLLYVAPERLVGDGGDGFADGVVGTADRASSPSTRRTASASGATISGRSTGSSAQLRDRWPGVSMHAFTATATARVRRDIVSQLGLRDPVELVGSFDRPNLVYRVLARATLKTADPGRARAPPGSGGHHLLPVAQRGGRAGGVAREDGIARVAVSRRPGRRRAASQSGRVPERRGGRRRGDRRVRHGHRSVGRALRRACRRAAIARALSAGIRPRRPRWPGGRVRARSTRRGLPASGG